MALAFEVNVFAVITAFTSACDLSELSVAHHGQRVAYIALRIAEHMHLPYVTKEKLLLAALLHDVGVSSSREKLQLADLNVQDDQVTPHCLRGAELLGSCDLFSAYSSIILRHHDPYTKQPPLLSRIIHLADRIEILIDKKRYILNQAEEILNIITSLSGTLFDPQLVKIVKELSVKPSFWFDLASGYYQQHLSQYTGHQTNSLSIEQLESLAQLYSRVIDAKSPFTSRHSQGVGELAVNLAKTIGFGADDVRLIRIAAWLHDLGKLAIPDEILESPGQLTMEQRQIMQQHPYYTYHLLNSLGPQAEKIRNWAGFHHEYLDGSGYPFGLTSTELDVGARIMAIADITQALQEERPYRKPLPPAEISKILHEYARAGKIDAELVQTMIQLLP